MNNLELKNKLLIYYSKEQLVNIIIQAIECIENRNTTKSKKERFMTGTTTLSKVLDILRGKDE